MEEPEITEEERRSFTSWKLRILDAMSCDIEVSDIDFRVAFRVMQHVNARTGQAHPSIDRIAAQIGVSRHTVMRSLKWLTGEVKRKDRSGPVWIDRGRRNRREPYFYTFREDRIGAVMDAKILREEDAKDALIERRDRAAEVANLQHRKSLDVANGDTLDVANLLSFDVAPVRPKHLTQNYLNRTPEDSKGSEGSESSAYARASGGY